jgi:hypothetical protein
MTLTLDFIHTDLTCIADQTCGVWTTTYVPTYTHNVTEPGTDVIILKIFLPNKM